LQSISAIPPSTTNPAVHRFPLREATSCHTLQRKQTSLETYMAKKALGIDPKLRRRRIYLQERVPFIDEEIKTLTGEKKTLEETFKRNPKDETDQGKQLRRRRMFVMERLEVLRDEKHTLVAERKELNEKFKSAGAAAG
jgi:hypothetical protein